jgi:hypothetical protein
LQAVLVQRLAQGLERAVPLLAGFASIKTERLFDGQSC